MNEALDLVRRELGMDAIVVESKKVATLRLLPWPSTRQEIEVSASLICGQSTSGRTGKKDTQKRLPAPRFVRTLAESRLSTAVSPALLPAIPELAADFSDDARATREQLSPPPEWLSSGNRSLSGDNRAKPVCNDLNMPTAASAPNVETPLQPTDAGLASLQTIVARLERQSRPYGMSDLPSELYQQYLKLVEVGVENDVAHDLISALQRQATHGSIESPAVVTTMLTALVEREMRCAPPIQPKPGCREIVTLVGPTGVGKTTTLAKLAGHFHLREGRRVGLITVDNYRVGAIEQLRTYAEIIQAPLRTASTPDELRIAIDGLDDVDLILIDTAGRSPLDGPKIDELRDFVRVAASDHVLLVLSLAGGAKALSRIAESFAVVLPTSLVLTKLDEAVGCGGLLSVAREIPIPVSYLTTGQDVPDEIEPAHPSRLARLIIGRDQISERRG